MRTPQYSDSGILDVVHFFDSVQKCATEEDAFSAFCEYARSIVEMTHCTFWRGNSGDKSVYMLEWHSAVPAPKPKWKSIPDQLCNEMLSKEHDCCFVSSFLENTLVIPVRVFNQYAGVLVLKADHLMSAKQEWHKLYLAANSFGSCLIHHEQVFQLQEQEELLTGTKEYLSDVLENMVHGVISLDETGRITTYSRGAELLLELPMKSVIGHNYKIVFPKEISAVIDQLKKRIESGLVVVEGEADYVLQGTYSIPIKFTASLLRDKKGKEKGIVLVCKDSSSVKRLVALQELRKMKSDFLSIASHEFKTPLNLITGSAGLLDEEIVGPLTDKQRRLVRLVKEGSQRLKDLITDLLDITRLEHNVSCADEQLNLSDVLGEVLILLEQQALQKHILIETQFADTNIFVQGTYDKLFKVFDNIINNAIKYTSDNGKVIIQAGYATHTEMPERIYPFGHGRQLEIMENAVEIIVADTGIGIPEDQLDKVFNEFYRVNHPYVRATEGTGLGLAITKKIVESLNGTIHVQSELGKGTRFSIYFPVSSASPVS